MKKATNLVLHSRLSSLHFFFFKFFPFQTGTDGKGLRKAPMENSLSSQSLFLKAGKLTTINTSVNQHEGRSLHIWPPQKLLWMGHGSADGVKEKTFFFTIFKTSLLVYAHTTIVNPGPSKVFEQYKWVNRTMKTDTMGIHLVSWFEPKSDGIANKYYSRGSWDW